MDTQEVVEEVGERIVSIAPNPKLIPVAIGLLAFGAGSVVGYFIGKRRGGEIVMLPSRDQVMEPYLKEAARYQGSGLVIPAEEHPKGQTPLTVIGKEGEQGKRTAYHKASGGEDVEIVTETRTSIEPLADEVIDAAAARHADQVRRTILGGMIDDWDYEAEKAHRTPGEPYIIHANEFEENEHDFTQINCTYYAGDDVLVNDADRTNPFPNYPRVVGELRFGHGSLDQNVVYIRNESRRMEYEIMREPTSWEDEVMGISEERNEAQNELRHERGRRFPRE